MNKLQHIRKMATLYSSLHVLIRGREKLECIWSPVVDFILRGRAGHTGEAEICSDFGVRVGSTKGQERR